MNSEPLYEKVKRENERLKAEVERLQNAFELLRSGRVTPEFFSR